MMSPSPLGILFLSNEPRAGFDGGLIYSDNQVKKKNRQRKCKIIKCYHRQKEKN